MDFLLDENVLACLIVLGGAVVAYYLYMPQAAPSKAVIPVVVPVKQAPKTKGPAAVRILWGSQTGTSEDFSNQLAQEAKKLAIDAEVSDLEDYDPDELESERIVILVLATYGEGEPTDNAKEFHEWLQSAERGEGSLAAIKFTVFGLGNKTYAHFNKMGRDVNRRLAELGATRIYDYGEGDDDAALEEDFMNWKRDLWRPICKELGVEFKPTAMGPTKPIFKTTWHESEPRSAAARKPSRLRSSTSRRSGAFFDAKNPHLGVVRVNRELHASDSDRSCRHIEIFLGDAMSYEPGDHLGVYASNRSEIVEQLAQILGGDMDRWFTMRDNKGQIFLGPATLRDALTKSVDLTSLPRKKVLAALAQYATDPDEKKKLEDMGDTESTLYNEFIKQDLRNIVEVLSDLPSCRPPIEHLLELLPKMTPRYYSISSAILLSPQSVHITAVVVQYEAPTKRMHYGVCTNWLKDFCPPDASIECFVRTSTFKMPKDASTPLVMVGPGTGLAPMRGFLQQREALAAEGTSLGKASLYFGCRNRHDDFLYEDELNAWKASGVLTSLHVAFSREVSEKVYVQHLMAREENQKEIWELIHTLGGNFYVCGDAHRMAKDVQAALVEIAKVQGGKTADEADAYVKMLLDSGRYQTDVWY